MRKKTKKHNSARIALRLPDLDHSKTSVLNSLSSPRSRRNYRFAMDQFISWYCSEPRLALNRTVVLRFRLYLESLGLAAATINQRLAAVRRLAYEAADSGPLSPELAAGIRRVKGVKQLGQRSGNWLNLEQCQLLLEKSDGESLRSNRDLAMIAILLGCGLRRAELASLRMEDVQIRQGHWAIVDLVGMGGPDRDEALWQARSSRRSRINSEGTSCALNDVLAAGFLRWRCVSRWERATALRGSRRPPPLSGCARAA
jgi:integrase